MLMKSHSALCFSSLPRQKSRQDALEVLKDVHHMACIFRFRAWEDSATSSARAGEVMVAGAMMGVCQSKISSSERLIGYVWPSSTDGSAADAVAGGGAVVGCVRKKLAACGNWKQRKLMREFWNTFVSSISCSCRASILWIWLRSCRMCSGGMSTVGAGDGGFAAGGLGGVAGVDAKLAGGVGIAVWSGTASVRSIFRMYSFRVQPVRKTVYLSIGRVETAARRQRAEMMHGNAKMPLSF
ncbi:hypothetical protein V6N13_020360 [Hibiscus sabdariffa]